jgi:protein-S-isoprenylcysteine O-methyltransferase Ste14
MLLVVGVLALTLSLHLVLPARHVDGYVRDAEGRPLRYRLNGLLVFAVTVGLFGGAVALGWLPADAFYRQRVPAAITACVLGLAFTAAVVLGAPPRGGLLADLYLGRLENPRWLGGRIDLKVFLYLFGAVLLELNVLSSMAHAPSAGTIAHAALFTFFVVDYLVFEEVHLYTYDFFAERVGFKLGWGCLCFYPFFYNVGLFTVADRAAAQLSGFALAGCVTVFLCGWTLSRGANLQKFLFRARGERHGEVLGGVLLCGGFWRVSRHVNYLGEILMAVGLAAVLGHPTAIGPWLYPLYYVALLVPRERADDRRCAAKYGALWDEYRRRVPYRIVPWVY